MWCTGKIYIEDLWKDILNALNRNCDYFAEKDIDSSVLSLFRLLTLEVHGNQRSMMHNISNNPSLTSTATNFNYCWCLLIFFFMALFNQEEADLPKCKTVITQQKKCTLFSTWGNWISGGCAGDSGLKESIRRAKLCRLLLSTLEGSIHSLMLCCEGFSRIWNTSNSNKI